ncbi:MotA/TolQ/ExbB proton channel family protein [Roseimicrobium gellanilyticum]|nr:MotA/TolQ/ExbB proton channel family protein [Roseimicrobium gellanilyticum]
MTLDTSAKGDGITEPIGTAPVLLRLHDGNFQFGLAKEDGSDIRIIAEDGKTELSYHIERYDSLLNEAFVWIKVPDAKPDAQVSFWLYYGHAEAERADDAKGTYDTDTTLVYHFSENNAAPKDFSTGGNHGEQAGVSVTGAQIAGGLRLTGQNTINVPASATLNAAQGAPMTWSAWVRQSVPGSNATIFSRREGANSLVIGADNGIPYVEVTTPGGTQRTTAGDPLPPNAWKHLAVVATNTQVTLYLDGASYATLSVELPAFNGPCVIGKDPGASGGVAGFVGELDEMAISKVARSAGFVKFAAMSQAGGEKTAKLLTEGADESAGEGGHHENELAKHLSLLKDISKDLTLDGWVVIYLCGALAIVGGIVCIAKLMYLSKINKATKAFMEKWEGLAGDLSSLDHGDPENVSSMGGQASKKVQKVLNQSPLYHIYKIGSAEIHHRISKAEDGYVSLSGRSVQAIRATLDGGLVRETQKLNSHLVFLTIGIAGGPYLGLLGTVIGVMITFAVIAKTGEVEVNSIAPGIAGALLATVAGLAVAIPCLFAYSYISTRIKDAVSDMTVFIDEFVAKIAEVFKD